MTYSVIVQGQFSMQITGVPEDEVGETVQRYVHEYNEIRVVPERGDSE